MMDDAQDRETVLHRRASAGRRRLKLALIAILLLLAIIFVPPFVNVSRYKSRITQVMSESLGRPVRLSSVELRLIPWPSFLLTDLSVAEDPAYGSEPVLHADTVRADLRLLSLWRGKFEISSIHVDYASLNLVRATPGHWNLDPLFRTAAARRGSPLHAAELPYLEATNSRINIKNGTEKLPFSLINTDLTFWQENPGDWRVRLRGQPARTDVALELGDTGVVRLEASVRRAPELHEMPLHLDLDWREAQLGALARLLTGSDPGWRGDLTGEAHLDGTPDAARVTTRLRAAGVHRAEFAPSSPLDFDANCGFVYHYSQRVLEKLECNSPLGDGRLRLTGTIPGSGEPDVTLALNRIPVAAGLDILRTLRSGISPSLEAAGTVSGRLVYAGAVADSGAVPASSKKDTERVDAEAKALSGSLTVDGFSLSGGALSQPLSVPHIVFQPVVNGDSPRAIAATSELQAGGAEPLILSVRLGLHGYDAALHGQASLSRMREMAQTAGFEQASGLARLGGSPAVLDLTAQGPWLPKWQDAGAEPLVTNAAGDSLTDTLTGTVTLHEAHWRTDYLVNPVEISSAILQLEAGGLRWDPVDFTYGPVKGSAQVTLPAACPQAESTAQAEEAADACVPRFAVAFGSIESAELESAFLGARRKGTLLSSLIDRLDPASAPTWPEISGTIHANAFVLGPLAVRQASAVVKISAQSAELSEMQGDLLGGRISGRATVGWAGDDNNQPSYSVDARVEGVSAAAAGQLLGMRWSGGPLNVHGKVELSGFTGADLASSAKGTLHFDWQHGSAAMGAGVRKPVSADAAAPAQGLGQFDGWSGDATIAKGSVTLGQNQLIRAGRKQTVDGEVTLSKPPKVQLTVTAKGAAAR